MQQTPEMANDRTVTPAEPVSDSYRLRVECLALAQNFETYWAYYTQSSGSLFSTECREAASDFLETFDNVAAIDAGYFTGESLSLGPDTNVPRIANALREWADSQALYPYTGLGESRFMLWAFVTSVKVRLITQLGLQKSPQFIMASDELEHAAETVRWRAHVPKRVLFENPQALIASASQHESIVLVADIRKSQDLMTFAVTPADFARRMLEFLEQARSVIDRHGGVFDKFTGDGLIAYFNPQIARRLGVDYVESFLSCAIDLQAFGRKHFEEWTASVRKLPSEPIGLAIGSDVGIVVFNDNASHLVAVGDAIVWASRMASEARAGEVVVNNLLYQLLRARPGVSFEPRTATTKGGEKVLCQNLRYAAT